MHGSCCGQLGHGGEAGLPERPALRQFPCLSSQEELAERTCSLSSTFSLLSRIIFLLSSCHFSSLKFDTFSFPYRSIFTSLCIFLSLPKSAYFTSLFSNLSQCFSLSTTPYFSMSLFESNLAFSSLSLVFLSWNYSYFSLSIIFTLLWLHSSTSVTPISPLYFSL